MTNELQALVVAVEKLQAVEMAVKQQLLWQIIFCGVLLVLCYALGRRR